MDVTEQVQHNKLSKVLDRFPGPALIGEEGDELLGSLHEFVAAADEGRWRRNCCVLAASPLLGGRWSHTPPSIRASITALP